MDDWQDAVFTSRRIPHGRSGKGGRSSGKKGAAAFNPQSAVGAYELSGTAVERLPGGIGNSTMEIHELTAIPGGLVGSLVIGDRFKAAVLLAGSRKKLAEIVDDAESADSDDDDADGEESDASSVSPSEDRETSIEAADRKHNERVAAFEKNSFRTPKFWLQWRGNIVNEAAVSTVRSDRGYVVFSGNDCKTFEGTLTCRALGWKNVPFTGRKVTSKAKPAPFTWLDFCFTDDEDEDDDAGGDDQAQWYGVQLASADG